MYTYRRCPCRSNSKTQEVWTPWVGKRSIEDKDKDRDIWTPWVGKRNGLDSLDEDSWVYPLPQTI